MSSKYQVLEAKYFYIGSEAEMHNFKELGVWQKARELNKKIYLLCRKFPDFEKYGLCSQIQRACVSIASNIAEGAGRGSAKEFVQFLHIAYGSSFELETQIMLACDLEYLSQKEMDHILEQIREVERMIYGLIHYHKSQKK